MSRVENFEFLTFQFYYPQSPETQKVRLKLLGEQFESERNTKTSKLKPKIIGIIWRGADNNFPSNGEYDT